MAEDQLNATTPATVPSPIPAQEKAAVPAQAASSVDVAAGQAKKLATEGAGEEADKTILALAAVQKGDLPGAEKILQSERASALAVAVGSNPLIPPQFKASIVHDSQILDAANNQGQSDARAAVASGDKARSAEAVAALASTQLITDALAKYNTHGKTPEALADLTALAGLEATKDIIAIAKANDDKAKWTMLGKLGEGKANAAHARADAAWDAAATEIKAHVTTVTEAPTASPKTPPVAPAPGGKTADLPGH